MEKIVSAVYEKFDTKRKINDAVMADELDMDELKKIEIKIKDKGN